MLHLYDNLYQIQCTWAMIIRTDIHTCSYCTTPHCSVGGHLLDTSYAVMLQHLQTSGQIYALNEDTSLRTDHIIIMYPGFQQQADSYNFEISTHPIL